VAPLAVTFNPAASSDDVQIVSYRWNFGGGDVRTTGTAASMSKTFNTPGSHTVSLQVTDNAGLTATASRTIIVTASPPAAEPHVSGIEMKLARGAQGRVKARATVNVVDGSGRPATGATVIAQWLDPVRGVSSGRTRSGGKVDLTSPSTAATGCLRLNVVAVRVSGRLYRAEPPVTAEVCRP
jgi:PKD repeat protein